MNEVKKMTPREKRQAEERRVKKLLEEEEANFRKTYLPKLFELMEKLSKYTTEISINKDGFCVSDGYFIYDIVLPHTLDNAVVNDVKGYIDSINRYMFEVDETQRKARELREAKNSAIRKIKELMTPEELDLLSIHLHNDY